MSPCDNFWHMRVGTAIRWYVVHVDTSDKWDWFAVGSDGLASRTGSSGSADEAAAAAERAADEIAAT